MFFNIKSTELDKLIKIFEEIRDNPNWYHESNLYQLYKQRITITEFFDLMSTDRDYSHLANKE